MGLGLGLGLGLALGLGFRLGLGLGLGLGLDSARSEGDELVGGGAERAGGVDHVVDDDAVRALDVAHQVRRAHLARPLALLDDHGEANPYPKP